MTEEWRSVVVLVFKNKDDVQSCCNYRGIKLINHTMKLWGRVVEAGMRGDQMLIEQQYGFMPGKSTTDATFAWRMLKREGQKELQFVCMDLKKACDRFPSEEVWYSMKLGIVPSIVLFHFHSVNVIHSYT